MTTRENVSRGKNSDRSGKFQFLMHNDSFFNEQVIANQLGSSDPPMADRKRPNPQTHDISQFSVRNLPKPAEPYPQMSTYRSMHSSSSPALASLANKRNLMIRLPGSIYRILGDFLGERLPLILFTNRISFKISLAY